MATCPFCGCDWVIRKDGTLRRHTDNFNGRECQGSRRKPVLPKQHVHRCACGASWDEYVDEVIG